MKLGRVEEEFLKHIIEDGFIREGRADFCWVDLQRWMKGKLTGTRTSRRKINIILKRLLHRGLTQSLKTGEEAPPLLQGKLQLFKLTEKGLETAKQAYLESYSEKIVKSVLAGIHKPTTTITEIQTLILRNLQQHKLKDSQQIFNQKDIEKVFTKDRIARILKRAGLKPKKDTTGRMIWVNPISGYISEAEISIPTETIAKTFKDAWGTEACGVNGTLSVSFSGGASVNKPGLSLFQFPNLTPLNGVEDGEQNPKNWMPRLGRRHFRVPEGGRWLFRVSSVAAMLGVTPRAVRKLIEEGKVNAVRLGRRFFIPYDKAMRLIREKIERLKARGIEPKQGVHYAWPARIWWDRIYRWPHVMVGDQDWTMDVWRHAFNSFNFTCDLENIALFTLSFIFGHCYLEKLCRLRQAKHIKRDPWAKEASPINYLTKIDIQEIFGYVLPRRLAEKIKGALEVIYGSQRKFPAFCQPGWLRLRLSRSL